MGLRELHDKYGSKNVKTWQAFNRAIRAEIPGGAELLDALAVAGKHRRTAADKEIYACMRAVRAKMQTEIAKRYDLLGAREIKETTRGE